jgi:hypothetical protein
MQEQEKSETGILMIKLKPTWVVGIHPTLT